MVLQSIYYVILHQLLWPTYCFEKTIKQQLYTGHHLWLLFYVVCESGQSITLQIVCACRHNYLTQQFQQLLPIVQLEQPLPICEQQPLPICEQQQLPICQQQPLAIFQQQPYSICEQQPFPICQQQLLPIFQQQPFPIFQQQPLPIFQQQPLPICEQQPSSICQQQSLVLNPLKICNEFTGKGWHRIVYR